MTRSLRLPRLALPMAVLTVAGLSAACADPGSTRATGASPSTSPGTPSTTPAPADGATSSAPASAAGGRGEVEAGAELPTLEVVAGDVRLAVTLYDNAAARSLVEQLPVTVQMSDHGGVEKTGRLPRPLDTTGMPAGEDPDVGELGYYSPGEDLVLYYGDQGYFDGILRLGAMSGDLDALSAVDGDVEVTVTRVD